MALLKSLGWGELGQPQSAAHATRRTTTLTHVGLVDMVGLVGVSLALGLAAVGVVVVVVVVKVIF
jgi:hypothetical protein